MEQNPHLLPACAHAHTHTCAHTHTHTHTHARTHARTHAHTRTHHHHHHHNDCLQVPPQNKQTMSFWSNEHGTHHENVVNYQLDWNHRQKPRKTNTKNYWKMKRRLCVKLFEVANTTWENLQIATHKSVSFTPYIVLICALQFADFLRLYL